MGTDIRTCMVVPCYNEGGRLPMHKYRGFIKDHPDALLCFVNDGSTDGTRDLLDALKGECPGRVEVVTLEKNRGKAEAVRAGVAHCNDRFGHRCIAFLDADLSVTLEECHAMRDLLVGGTVFCFGSRVARVGSTIERKWSRHLAGRVVATMISGILALRVYDTQCGCKLFTREVSVQLFAEPFLSRWLFDVELFSRFIGAHGMEGAMARMAEVPLKEWIDRGVSKVRPAYFFRMWYDLYLIRKAHRRAMAQRATRGGH